MIDTEALRKKILEFAIQGKLTEQLYSDGNAEDLYVQIQKEKCRIIKEGKGKKDKPLNTIIDNKILYEIPKNWKFVRLGDISLVISKGTTPRGGKLAYIDSGIGFLRVENLVGYNKIDVTSLKYIDEETHNGFLKRSVLETGDILISIAGTLGRTGLVREENLPLNTNQAIAFIRIAAKNMVDVEYISYILNADIIQKELGNKKVAMAIPNLSLDVISKTVVPLPPLSEQKRIVEKLNSIFSQIDIIDELQKKYGNDLEILKSKIIDAGIRGKLTDQLPEDGTAEELYEQIQEEKARLIKEGKIKKTKELSEITEEEIPFDIPNNWKWVRVNDIGSWSAGATPARTNKEYYNNGTIPWLKTGELNDGIVESSEEYITEKALKNCSVRLNPVGSVLIAMYGATIGKIGILNIEATTNQACCACIPYLIDNRYLFYFLKSNKKVFLAASHGGAQPNISKDIIIKSVMPLPPLAEQKRIVKKINSFLEYLN